MKYYLLTNYTKCKTHCSWYLQSLERNNSPPLVETIIDDDRI